MQNVYMGDKLPKKELIRLLKELYKQVDVLAGTVKILESEISLLKTQNILRPDPNRRPYTPPNVPWYKIPPVTCDSGQAGQFIEDIRKGDLVPNAPNPEYIIGVDPITSDARSVSMADPKRQMGNSNTEFAKAVKRMNDLIFPVQPTKK